MVKKGLTLGHTLANVQQLVRSDIVIAYSITSFLATFKNILLSLKRFRCQVRKSKTRVPIVFKRPCHIPYLN